MEEGSRIALEGRIIFDARDPLKPIIYAVRSIEPGPVDDLLISLVNAIDSRSGIELSRMWIPGADQLVPFLDGISDRFFDNENDCLSRAQIFAFFLLMKPFIEGREIHDDKINRILDWILVLPEMVSWFS
jgi:hypothetical protein